MIKFLIKTICVLLLLQNILLSQDINIGTTIKIAKKSDVNEILYLHRYVDCNFYKKISLETYMKQISFSQRNKRYEKTC